LTFSILSGNTSNAFVLDPVTGVLRVNNSSILDFEARTSFSLSVQVTDVPGLSKTATVTVNLNNMNEPPIIGAQSFTVNENSANGTVVGTVIARDPEGTALTFSILSGNTSNAFILDAITGVLRVNNSSVLDFEARTSFSLSVQATDVTGLSKAAAVTVNLNNVNEPPVIGARAFSINENSANGTVVGTVLASDPERTALTFSILSGNTSNAFVIDPLTGVIRVNNSSVLDYEVRTSFSLSVQATDVPGLSSAATVTINLIDVIETGNQPPVVSNQSFTSGELVSVGQLVGTVLATDPNPGDVLTYAIASGNTGNVFALNSTTGVITVRTPIPATTVPPTFVVRVSDQGGLSSTATMTVTVSTKTTPVAFFPFSEGTGTVTVDQSGSRTATLNGPTWNTGKVGKGLNFDGINDWVTVPDDNGLDFTTSFTIAAWVQPSSVGTWRTAMLKERSGGLAYGLYASDDRSRPAVYINLGGADLNATGTSALPLNTWSHLAATFDGSTVRLYVNGKQAAQLTARGSVVTSQSPLRIGGNAVWGEYMKGGIDEVRLYKTALSAAEITALQGATGMFTAGTSANLSSQTLAAPSTMFATNAVSRTALGADVVSGTSSVDASPLSNTSNSFGSQPVSRVPSGSFVRGNFLDTLDEDLRYAIRDVDGADKRSPRSEQQLNAATDIAIMDVASELPRNHRLRTNKVPSSRRF
jgi:hypothetical protein